MPSVCPVVDNPDPCRVPAELPDITLSVRDVFKIDSDLQVPAFSAPEEHVPPRDPDSYPVDQYSRVR